MRKTNKIFYRKIQLSFEIKKPILAMGSQTKNTLCFAKENFAYLSPLHQDLANPGDFKSFQEDVKYFLKKTPKIIAYDLHPEYQSTKYALNLYAIRYTMPAGRQALYAIQHHHAHIASCLFDNNIEKKVIGICFDGTGFGLDTHLWGAEFFIADFSKFRRIAHLEYIPLIGGRKAIEEPWRVGFAWLYKIYKDRLFKLDIDFVKRLERKKCQIFTQMLKNNLNCPLSSSMGRLFDSVSSLLGLVEISHFEAEPAIELEKKAGLITNHKSPTTNYSYKINLCNDNYIIDPKPMFKDIIKDLEKKVSVNEIALKFHYTVIGMMKDACRLIRRKTRLNTVVLSGGVFQNKILSEEGRRLLEKEGFKVFRHSRFSTTDSSISLGQALIANKLYREV
mgnify:CR=1 FL=1